MFVRGGYRRHLPHFQNDYRIYLSTFVTLHRSILPPAARDVAFAEIVRQHNATAFIHTAVVMPDHVHIVLQPLWDDTGKAFPLHRILGVIKGSSAREINRGSNRSGTLWLDESHDHQIRNDGSLMEKCEYVAHNPVRKGLVATR